MDASEEAGTYAAIGFRCGMKDFAPSCFQCASTGAGIEKGALAGAS